MQRLNPAEKLSDVIDLLCSRQYSGLLSVERFAKGRFQEGEIYFEQGRSVYARCDQQLGKEAFARLETWRQVYFALDKNAPRPLLQERELSQSMLLSSYLLDEESLGITQPLFSDALYQEALSGLYGSISSSSSSLSAVEQLVPHKSEVALNVLSLPLTRAQRAVYLLVDGKRTVVDLARCVGKSILIVMKLLNDLLELGLILL